MYNITKYKKTRRILLKKTIRFLAIFLLMTLLSGCSSKPSLELISSSATISNDESIAGSIGITEGEKKGQELVPTVLYYQFTIKNTGWRKIGGIGNKGLAVKIVPHDKLKTTLEDVIGINIFNPDDYMSSGLGYGQSSDSLIKSGKEGNFTLTYDLGVSEESPNTKLITPSDELLAELKNQALDASLVVTCDGKEIAEFDLSKE
jgi:hypothetical protein